MKKSTIFSGLALVGLCLFSACQSEPKDPSQWSEEELNQWVSQKEYLGELQVAPAAATDFSTLASSYFLHKDRWDMAFDYLKNTDLTALEPGTYDLMGKDVYVIVPNPYVPKVAEEVRYEAHRRYADIQYIVSGHELMMELPLEMTRELTAYEAENDLIFVEPDAALVEANPEAVQSNPADPSAFYIFFPEQAHKAGVRADSVEVKRVVIKVRLD